uniref:Mannose receptor, C type 1b n=1 Tax=Astyanax mexicanus TaxID=7994 RepID=A0A3B1JA80_ASTMX
MMVKSAVITVLLLMLADCFAQSDWTFLIYNAHKNRCLGSNLQRLDVCDPHSPRQHFRWTSENSIFNIAEKKCLGTGSISEGNKLQWYTCDATSALQKWECQTNLKFSVKNESLYLSLQGDSYLLTLSRDPGEKGKWTLHGTMDSVCSRPYEEMYTIKGNALGRPCQFPFRYKNNWYADCTKEDSAKKRLWCAIESVYEVNELWGYCPTREKVDDFWKKNPLTNVYYQVNGQSALTWYQARKSCQQQGGDLLSITEPHEQTFISGLIQQAGSVFWTGLNSLDASRGWHWVNAQPLRYLNWISGQPSSLPGHSCGVLDQSHDSGWSTAVCSEKHGYICQRGLPTPTVPPVVHTGSCHSPWIPYSGHCYLLSRTKRTWLEAKDSCRREGGDLLSILNVEEQSFTISQLGYAKTDELWIGLNDLKTSMLFEWSDHSNVQFALWDVNEPSHNAALKENCVLMKEEEGKWADQICQKKYGYICKKKSHLQPSTNDTAVTNPGCKAGWVRYGYYCFLAGSETKTFEEARKMCEKAGSYLVDITNRIENAFLVSLIGARPEKHFWIGLSNMKDKHTFEWTNTTKVQFTHFNAGMPGGRQGCVAMTTGVLAGLWDVLSCTNTEKYICKQKAEGLITTMAPPTTPAPSCNESWSPIPNRDFCYKLFSVEQSQRKTWYEALDYCRDLGGDLLSIHGTFSIEAEGLSSSTAWIGYSIQDPSVGFTWSDGSSSSYENWQEGEPNNLNNAEQCVTVLFHWWRSTELEWNDLHCQDKCNWLCEIRKGVTPKTVEITEKTYNTTEDGWIIFKDNQYYFSDEASSMESARRFCKHRHGDLVSINDEEERVFVWHQCYKLNLEKKTWLDARSSCKQLGGNLASVTNSLLQATLTLKMAEDNSPDLWLGLSNLAGYFKWTDGSSFTFIAWRQEYYYYSSEPRCATIGGKQSSKPGKWLQNDCNDTNGYICSRALDHLIKPTPTELPKTFIKLGNSSYMLVQTNMTWKEAQSHCQSVGANLVSIQDVFTQSYIHLQAHKVGRPLWIGLNSMETDGYFLWIDNWQLNIQNWDYGEPKKDHPCVYVDTDGNWKSAKCNQTYYSVCKKSSEIAPTPPAQFPGMCPEETEDEPTMTWLPFRGHCYAFVTNFHSWVAASNVCNRKGGSLASIQDTKEAKFIENYISLLGNNQEKFWIGLFKTFAGHWLWVDKSVVDYTNWEQSNNDEEEEEEDDGYEGKNCAFISAESKQWKQNHCVYSYAMSICKIAKVMHSTTAPNQTGPDTHRTHSAVVSVVVVILVVSVLAGLAYVYYRTSKRRFVLPAVVNPLYYTTEVSQPEDKDTKTLVDHMQ